MTSSAERTSTRSIFTRPAVAYGVAIGLTVGAALMRLALEPVWGDRAPYVLFVLAVLISGRYGGLGPGLVSTGVAAIAAAYLLVEPAYVWGIRYPADLLGWTVFVGVGVAISITNESWRRQMRRESDAREQAATTSRQLEIAIESGRMGTWEYDLGSRQVRWSAALEAIHGYAPGTFPGTIEAFRQEILDEDRERVMAAIATSAQGNAERLIESLLDLSRLESGKFELRMEPLELSTVISRAVDVVGPTADAKGIRLLFTPPSAGIHLDGDADRLQQVVWNLLSNGVKFTPSGGSVEVRLSETDGLAQIEITDTGRGISADFMPHLFERFRQAESATSSGGLGIGLALVRELVEAHGGTVAATSQGRGQGSTFTIALPLRVTRGGLAPASSPNPHVADHSPTPCRE